VLAQNRLLRVEDVAERMQASTYTVRRWLREGRLKGILPGGKKLGYRIEEAELERFIKSGGAAADPE
jgi:excisionase family DNA binding protein